jgi:HEAT repeat protein
METNKLRSAIDKLRQELGIPTLAALWRAANVDTERWNKLAAPDAPKAKPTREDIEELIEGFSSTKHKLSTAQERALYEAIGMNVTLTESERESGLASVQTIVLVETGAEAKAERSLAEANSEAEKAQVRLYLRLLDQTFEKFEDFNKLMSLPMRSGKLGKVGHWRKTERERLWRNLTPTYAAKLPATSMSRIGAIPATQLSPDESQPEVAVEEFLQEHTRITLLGAPGAGKSTTLRRLVRVFGYYWTGQAYPDQVELQAEWQGRIPLFGFLNQWQNTKMGLVEFVQEQIRRLKRPTPPLLEALAQRVPELIAAGRVILLLDGLNELPGAGQGGDRIADPRASAIAELGEKAEWWDVGCVLSCRVKAFTSGLNWKWQDLHVLPLKRAQVEEFAHAYFEGHPEAEVLVSRLIEELYESKNKRKEKLQKLAEQPFYLRKFLSYYEALGFPDNAAQLLNHSLEEALRHEVEDKTGLLNSKEEGEELATRLSYLAFKMTAAERVGGVNEVWAAQQKAKELLRQGEGVGLMVVAQSGNIQFSHQLWQEYFAARYLCTAELNKVLLTNIANSRFREVWPIWAGLDETVVKRLSDVLQHSSDSKMRWLVAVVLGKLGDHRAVESLSAALQSDKHSSVRGYATLALGNFKDKRAVEPLIAALQSDEDSSVRYYAVAALGQIEDRRAVEPLIAALQSDRNGGVRCNAAEALGNLKDKRAVEPLIAALQSDEKWEVRHSAACALGKLGDQRALPALEEAAKRDGCNTNWGGLVKYRATEAIKWIKGQQRQSNK